MTDKLIDGSVDIQTATAVANVQRVNAALTDTAIKSAQAAEKASELFQRGIGGGEAAEKMKKISEGLRLYGDQSINATDRGMALAGSLGMMARMAAGAAEGILAFAQQVLEATAKVDQHQRSLDTLGSTYTDAISITDQLTIREGLLSHNLFLTSEQTEVLNGRMREFATVHGGTAAEAAGRFQAAVASADNNALAQFGVHIDEIAPGTARATTALERMSAATRQLAEQHSTHPIIPQTATERLASYTTTLDGAKNAVLAFLNPFSSETRAADANSRAITNLNRILDENRQRTLSAAQAAEALTAAESQAASARLRAEERESLAYNEGLRQTIAREAAARARGATQGAAATERHMLRTIELRTKMIELDERSMAVMRDVGVAEDAAAASRRTHDEERAAQDAETERSIEDHQKAQQARQREEDTRNSTTQQANLALAQYSQASVTHAEIAGQAIANVAASSTAAVKSHMAALIEGHENIGEALRGIVHEVGLNLAVESGTKALFATAEGVFRIARSYGADATGYALLGNAAMFGAIALAGGIAAAVTNPPAVSGGASAGAGGGSYHSSGAAAGGPSSAGGGGGGNVTYQVNISGVMGNEQTQDMLRGTLQDMHVRGATPQFMQHD